MKKLLILAVLIAACGESEKPKNLEYIPGETPATGVYLRLITLDDQSLTLEIVGNEITNLYGLAFRLYYDPDVLDFTEMTPSAAWPANAISIARKNSTGTLTAAITNRGPATGLDFTDQVIATLSFTLRNETNSCINFSDLRCALVDTTGTEIPDQTWTGGRLELR